VQIINIPTEDATWFSRESRIELSEQLKGLIDGCAEGITEMEPYRLDLKLYVSHGFPLVLDLESTSVYTSSAASDKGVTSANVTRYARTHQGP